MSDYVLEESDRELMLSALSDLAEGARQSLRKGLSAQDRRHLVAAMEALESKIKNLNPCKTPDSFYEKGFDEAARVFSKRDNVSLKNMENALATVNKVYERYGESNPLRRLAEGERDFWQHQVNLRKTAMKGDDYVIETDS